MKAKTSTAKHTFEKNASFKKSASYLHKPGKKNLFKLKHLFNLNAFESKILIYFVVLQSLIYILLIAYWNQIHHKVVSLSVIMLAVLISNVLQLIYIFRYFRYRQEQKLYENFGFYHLHLEPILSIIQKKEMKLYQMTVDFKNSLPLSQEEMELRAQKIVNDCFIQLNFTSDALLNALFFKYYNLFQSRQVEMKTLVSNDFKLEKAHQLKLYEAVEFSFEVMMWLLSNERLVVNKNIQGIDGISLLPSMSLSKQVLKRISFVLLQTREGLQFDCCYESEFADLVSIIQYFEKEKKKKYMLRYFGRNIHLELSPNSTSIKGVIK